MKKRMVSITLAFCLLFLTAVFALAAPGDQTLLGREELRSLAGQFGRVQESLLMEDQLFLLFQTKLVRFGLGEEDPTTVLTFLPEDLEGNLWVSTLAEAQAQLGENAENLFTALFNWKDTLYLMNQLTQKAYPVDVAQGQINKEAALVLPLVQQGEEEDRSETSFQGVIGDSLFVVQTNYAGQVPQSIMFSIDLNTLEKTLYQSPNIQSVIGYKDGLLLAEVRDMEKIYGGGEPLEYKEIAIFDPANDSLSPFGQVSENNTGGFSYSPKEDTLYYVKQGVIYTLKQGETQGEAAAYTGNQRVGRGGRGWITQEGLYVLAGGDPNGILVKNTDPAYRAQTVLTLYGHNDTSAATAKAFQQNYPEIALTQSDGDTEQYRTGQAITQAIQSGDTKVDIFFVDPQRMDFEMVMKKEYAYPLNGSALISERAAKFYPYVQRAISQNGQFYALPTYSAPNGMLSYSQKVWEELGLRDEDVPTTYMEFLDLAARWENQIKKEQPGYYFINGSDLLYKADLVYLIVDEYVRHYQQQGQLLTFDTPLFRELMEKINAMNLPAEWNPEQSDGFEDDEEGKALFKTVSYLLAGGNMDIDDTRNLFLPLKEGMEPAVMTRAQIAFINPASQHPEEALRYLETLITNYEPQDQIAMFSDKNEPVQNEGYFDKYRQEKEGELETLKAYLLEAQEEVWEISPKDIETFNQVLPNICFPTTELFYSMDGEGDGADVLWNLENNYINGAISLDEFIKQADQRIEMSSLERE